MSDGVSIPYTVYTVYFRGCEQSGHDGHSVFLRVFSIRTQCIFESLYKPCTMYSVCQSIYSKNSVFATRVYNPYSVSNGFGGYYKSIYIICCLFLRL